MRDEHKTREQPMNELAELRQRVAELETSEIERKRAEEAVHILADIPHTFWKSSDGQIFLHEMAKVMDDKWDLKNRTKEPESKYK